MAGRQVYNNQTTTKHLARQLVQGRGAAGGLGNQEEEEEVEEKEVGWEE